jgi:hypothetical protein
LNFSLRKKAEYREFVAKGGNSVLTLIAESSDFHGYIVEFLALVGYFET